LNEKQDVLRSVGQATEKVAEADDKNTYIDEEFSRFISESYVVDFNGNQVDVDAFEVMLELNAEIRKPQEEAKLPGVCIYSPRTGEKKNTWSRCAAKGSGVPSGDMWPWMMT
jgi:hypothetical protein